MATLRENISMFSVNSATIRNKTINMADVTVQMFHSLNHHNYLPVFTVASFSRNVKKVEYTYLDALHGAFLPLAPGEDMAVFIIS